MIKKESKLMKELFSQEKGTYVLPQVGDLIEGRIIKISNNELIVELGPLGTGVVYGGELRNNKDIFRELKVGQKISALVVDPENEDGYVELSLKEASLEQTWSELQEKEKSGQTITVKVIEANRGGLVIGVSGMIGFLPVSQLSPSNYPRVEGGDKDKILQELNKFVGKEMEVKIITLDKRSEKIVVSEKAIQEKKMKESLKKYKKGDIVEGIVTAVVNFGAFIKFDDTVEGLAHISELDWQIIDHPSQVLKENDKIKAQIIDNREGQISLSLKTLKENPWHKVKDKYTAGQTVKGKVIKFTSLGAFVQINKGIHGLAHLSEFSKQNQQMENALEIGQSYNFEILSLSPEVHKISLSLK